VDVVITQKPALTKQDSPPAVTGVGTRTDSFGPLYEAHFRTVYRYVLVLTRSHEDTEEICGEAFERAFRAHRRAELPPSPVPWLLTVARRLATDRWRRAKRAAERLVTGWVPGQESKGDQERTEFWLWFEAVSKVLNARQREVLLLRYQRDLNDDEIARVMNLSPSGVRSLAARALERLRAHPEILR